MSKIMHERMRAIIDFNSPHYEEMIMYIKQQERKDELFEQLYNVCKEYKHTSIGLSDDSQFIKTMNDIEVEMK